MDAVKDRGHGNRMKSAGATSHCPAHGLVSHLGDKWTILVLTLLAAAPKGRLRFHELRSGLDGISQKMLTLTLRKLERDGLLFRQLYAEMPPRVEYGLSALGRGLEEKLAVVAVWLRENWPAVEDARASYDADRRDRPIDG